MFHVYPSKFLVVEGTQHQKVAFLLAIDLNFLQLPALLTCLDELVATLQSALSIAGDLGHTRHQFVHVPFLIANLQKTLSRRQQPSPHQLSDASEDSDVVVEFRKEVFFLHDFG